MELRPSGALEIQATAEGTHIADAALLSNPKLAVGSYRHLGPNSFPYYSSTSAVVGEAAIEGFRLIVAGHQTNNGLTRDLAAQYLEELGVTG